MPSSFAFIIPVFPRDYNYIYYNLQQFINSGIDLYLVFTNVEEYNLFQAKQYIRPIIMPPGDWTNTIVTSKKFYALRMLADTTYDYFVVTDAEIIVHPDHFNKDNISSKIEKIYTGKNVFGGLMDKGAFVNNIAGTHVVNKDDSWQNGFKKNAAIFSAEDYEKLKELTSDFLLCVTWGDIPVYKRANLKDFFTKIDESKIVDRSPFDDIIHSYYLVLHQGFRFVNVTEHIPDMKTSFEEILEFTPKELEITKNLGYSFSWITRCEFFRHREFFEKERTFMFFHVDRENIYNQAFRKRTQFNTP